MAIKLTKNELKVQKDRLKQYQRYLPTVVILETCTAAWQPVTKKLWTLMGQDPLPFSV